MGVLGAGNKILITIHKTRQDKTENGRASNPLTVCVLLLFMIVSISIHPIHAIDRTDI